MGEETCPKCRSDEIILDTGGHTGKYRCKKCGYSGPLIIEEGDKKEPADKEKGDGQGIEKDSTFLNSVVMVAAVVAVLGLILLGIKLFSPRDIGDIRQEIIEKGETEHGYMYNGYVFIQQGGLWHTERQREGLLYNLHFHYSPAEVDVSVPVEGELRKDLDTSKIYITFDPSEKNISLIGVAMSELGLNLVKGMGAKTVPACYNNESEACYERPIITCTNTNKSVVWVRSAETAKVLLDDNCIILQGPGEDVLKAVDKMLFDWYGIIESS